MQRAYQTAKQKGLLNVYKLKRTAIGFMLDILTECKVLCDINDIGNFCYNYFLIYAVYYSDSWTESLQSLREGPGGGGCWGAAPDARGFVEWSFIWILPIAWD